MRQTRITGTASNGVRVPYEVNLVADIPSTSLRDQYAMAALTGFLARGDGFDDSMPGACYRIADQMLAARKEGA